MSKIPLKKRNPPLKPIIIDGLSQLVKHYCGPQNEHVQAAAKWIEIAVANERDRLCMENPVGRFQILQQQEDGSKKAVYGSELTQPLAKAYMRMQNLGMRVEIIRDRLLIFLGSAVLASLGAHHQ